MDRRTYQRIKVDVESIFIVDNTSVSPREFEGIIEDISESGMKILIKAQDTLHLLPYIEKGQHLHFSAADDFHLFGQERSSIFSGMVEIIRREALENDLFLLGCKFKRYSNELQKYVSDRKLSLYMNGLKSANE